MDGQTKSNKKVGTKTSKLMVMLRFEVTLFFCGRVFELQMVISHYLEKVVVSLPSLFPFRVHVSTLNIGAVRD